MNLYLKYGPLAYTWNTRISHEWEKKLKWKSLWFNLFGYFFYAICIWMIPFLCFYIDEKITPLEFVKSIWLYVLLFIIFSIFYEIWYLHNDYVAKNESNPTLHIYEKVDNKFYIIQIILRAIFWVLWLLVIHYISPVIAKIFTILIIIMLIVFLLHNMIRNYFYNFITLLWLRFMKFSLVLVILYFVLWTFDSVYYLYLSLLYLMFQDYDHIVLFNKRMWWINKIENWLWKYCYLSISCIIFFIFSKDFLFVYYALLYFWLFIALTSKKLFIPKNNR